MLLWLDLSASFVCRSRFVFIMAPNKASCLSHSGAERRRQRGESSGLGPVFISLLPRSQTHLLKLPQQISDQNILIHQHKQWTTGGREDKAQGALGDTRDSLRVVTCEPVSRQRGSFPRSLWLGRESRSGVNWGRACI